MKKSLGIAVILVSAAALTGCKKPDLNDVGYESISGHLTPELMTTTERKIDVDRHMAVTKNVNWRLMWDDMGRAWLTDHPSHLSPMPIQKTSGKAW